MLEGNVEHAGRRVGEAIAFCFVSPNEVDRNGEEANIVDAVFAVARGLDNIARAIREHKEDEEDGRAE